MERKFKRDRGFFTIAQNGKHDYIKMAYLLALSLKATQQDYGYLSIGVTADDIIPDKYFDVFDEIVVIPWADDAADYEWKLQNEWKVYHMTPYKETIKLDCDMLFSNNISFWWDTLATQDVVACTNTITYRNEIITSDYCRKCFTANKLPNVYTAFMYFKYSDLAQELFQMVEIIFQNWDHMTYTYMPEDRPKELSTDVAFALAMKILNIEDACTTTSLYPKFVHMKAQLQNWNNDAVTEEWTKHIGCYITEKLQVKIGTHQQLYPLHYHDKTFATDEIIEIFENKVLK